MIIPVIIQKTIRHPAAIKRNVALFCRSPKNKKLEALDDTNKKYPPTPIKIRAQSKVDFLNKDAICSTQLMARKKWQVQIINDYESRLIINNHNI